MTDGACPSCTARDAVLRYYNQNIRDGEVGRFIDGVMEAVAQVAALNVQTGRETDEREILVSEIGRRFDRAVLAAAEAAACEAVRQ